MQDAMTIVITATTLLFAAATTIDFATGLIKLWQDAGSKAQPQVEPAPIEQMEVEEIIVSEIEPAPAAQKIATLDWVERNLPPAEIYIAELPNVIELAKSRMPKTAPVVELVTRDQLIALGIRRCKKLASRLGVRSYSNLKLSQLADVLVNKITANDLAV